jgi:hypothetical protein
MAPKVARYQTAVALAARHCGLPMPEREYRFNLPRTKHRFDFCWPALRIALEVEGGVWVQGRHTRGAGFLKDMEKYNLAASQRWLVFRTTPKECGNLALYRLIVQAAWCADLEARYQAFASPASVPHEETGA